MRNDRGGLAAAVIGGGETGVFFPCCRIRDDTRSAGLGGSRHWWWVEGLFCSAEVRAKKSGDARPFLFWGFASRTTLLWEQLSIANRERLPLFSSRQFILAFLPMTLGFRSASDVSLLFAIRSLRRACTL